MKFDVGDIVYIAEQTSLYRITEVCSNNTYRTIWIGEGNRNVPQRSSTHESHFKLYRKATKLEKAVL